MNSKTNSTENNATATTTATTSSSSSASPTPTVAAAPTATAIPTPTIPAMGRGTMDMSALPPFSQAQPPPQAQPSQQAATTTTTTHTTNPIQIQSSNSHATINDNDNNSINNSISNSISSSNPWNVSPAVTATQSELSANASFMTATWGSDDSSNNSKNKMTQTQSQTQADSTTSVAEQQHQNQQQQQQQPLIDYPGATPAVDTTHTSTNGTTNVATNTNQGLSVVTEQQQQQQQQPQQHPLSPLPPTPASTLGVPVTPTAGDTTTTPMSTTPNNNNNNNNGINISSVPSSGTPPPPPNTTTTTTTADLLAVQTIPTTCTTTTMPMPPQTPTPTTTTTTPMMMMMMIPPPQTPGSMSMSVATTTPASPQGGRLWLAALQDAQHTTTTSGGGGQTTPRSPPTKERSRFAESIMEQTRSRADPNALISPCGTNATGMTTLGGGGTGTSLLSMSKPSMITIGGGDGHSNTTDASYILSSALAKKRVRVVQLLLIGLVGLLLGLLGNFFVSTSCHFATVQIVIGQNDKVFDFHFGLWKYSPIDSVFQGYSYCFKYDQNYNTDAPVVARIANIAALFLGLIAISILWLYLIFGFADKRRWKWAVRIAVLAAFIQLSTLYFFVGKLCQEYTCLLGPGAYLTMFTSVVWLVLACEMHYHRPMAAYASGYSPNPNAGASLDEPRSLVTSMEMSHLDDVTREYLTRVTGKTKEDEMPCLSTDLKQRVRPRSGLFNSPTTFIHGGSELYFPTPRGTYQAPDPSLLEEALVMPSHKNNTTSSITS